MLKVKLNHFFKCYKTFFGGKNGLFLEESKERLNIYTNIQCVRRFRGQASIRNCYKLSYFKIHTFLIKIYILKMFEICKTKQAKGFKSKMIKSN